MAALNFPSSPTNGQVYTANGVTFIYDSTVGAWEGTISIGTASITASDTPPVSPSAGNLWFSTDEGSLFVYYDSFWIDTSAANGANGLSAYEVAVIEGFVGDETAWLASLVGATGASGAQGPTGPAGAASTVAGPTGPTGPQGNPTTVNGKTGASITLVPADIGAAPSTGIAPSAITGTAVVTTDTRLSDTRTPTDNSVTSAKIVDGAIVNADINAAAAIAPSKISGTAVVDSDARLTNSRTPTAHKSTHATGGTDVLTPSDIGAAPASGIAPSAITGTAVITTDARLSDTRTPTDNSVTSAKIVDGAIVNADINVSAAIAQSKIASLTTDLAAKASLASPQFTGIVTADNYDIRLTTLASDSVVLNFSGDTGLYTRTAAGNISFTSSNYRVGAIKTVRIIPGASLRTLTFPASWVFVGTKPTSVDASKTGILTVTSFGTTEGDCVAAWAVQE